LGFVHSLGHEHGTVVEAHVGRRASLEGRGVQDVDDAVGVDATINVDGEGLPGEFVDQVQSPLVAAKSCGGGFTRLAVVVRFLDVDSGCNSALCGDFIS
jgi:nitrogen-specific signal transduction histidine kinase